MKIDCIIVGQGIAGTLLASALEDHGKSFIVFDDNRKHAASRLAAGLINPITGRRYVKSWNYDTLEKIFVSVYRKIENKLATSFLFEHEIILCLNSVKEENDLLSQAQRYDYTTKLKHVNDAPKGIIFKNRYAFYTLSGYKLEIALLCNTYRTKLISEGLLREELFDHSALQISRDQIQYNDIVCDRIVFCEGAFGKENPLFPDNGVIPNKGQFFYISSEGLNSMTSIKDKIAVVPITNNSYWVGATYEWEFENLDATPAAFNELNKELEHLIMEDYTISQHVVGLRPTTLTRRHILSQSNMSDKIYMLNGLGTKGSSLGPYAINGLMKEMYK